MYEYTLDSLLKEFMKFDTPYTEQPRIYSPVLTRTDTADIITYDVPGFVREEIEIKVSDKIAIWLDGKRGKKVVAYTVNRNKADVANITSSLEHGVLTITIPYKKEETFTIKID